MQSALERLHAPPPIKTAHVSDPNLDQPIRNADDLLAPFYAWASPPSSHRIGAEMEKFGVLAGGAPIPYEGEHGVLQILERLSRDYGWAQDREKPGAPLLALLRDGASVTLEPGAQLELSGAPHASLHDVDAELRQHLREIGPVSRELGITWLALGFHPFAKREDMRWVPKPRYPIMRGYLPTRGAHALDMMLRTCTVQANFDYASEHDALRKLRVSLKLAPLTTAMFANSPWKEGAPHGGKTYRGRVWLDVDPDRSGLVPAVWNEKSTFTQYIEWALDIPMFLFKRDGKVVENTGQTFRDFWKNGYEGEKPTQADWQLHLNTLFPEVRLKKTIEIRGADSQNVGLMTALAAVWTGIFYDAKALAEAEALTEGFTHDEVALLREGAWREGLRATFRGQSLAMLAEKVVTIANGGLARRAFLNGEGKDERVYMSELEAFIARGECPADALLRAVQPGAPFVESVIAATTLPTS